MGIQVIQEKLPQGWHWVRCQDVIDVRDGTHDTPKYVPQGIPLITSKNLARGFIDFSDVFFISETDHEHIKKRSQVDKGDIIMPMIGTIGNPVLVDTNKEFSIKNVALFKFKNSSVFSPFFYYLLQSPLIVNQLVADAQGVTQQFVSLGNLRDLQIPLPPLAEQKRIAALAQKTDRLRRTRHYALQLSDTYLRSVFLELFGDPATNPNEWEITRLGDLLETSPQNGLYVQKENYENGSSNNSVEMVHMSDLFYGIVRRGNLKRVNISAADIKKYSIGYNDLLVARRSLMYEGAAKPCLIPESNAPLVFESSIIRVTVNKFKLLPVYLYYYLSNERARFAHVLRYVTESTISGINQNGLSNIEIIQPPLPLQEKFAQIVQKFDRLRTQQREADRQAEHLFQTLLHRAFRGELTSQNANDEPESVLLEEIGAQQAEAKTQTATQAMGEAADYLGTKAKQQDIEPIQLKFPGFE